MFTLENTHFYQNPFKLNNGVKRKVQKKYFSILLNWINLFNSPPEKLFYLMRIDLLSPHMYLVSRNCYTVRWYRYHVQQQNQHWIYELCDNEFTLILVLFHALLRDTVIELKQTYIILEKNFCIPSLFDFVKCIWSSRILFSTLDRNQNNFICLNI